MRLDERGRGILRATFVFSHDNMQLVERQSYVRDSKYLPCVVLPYLSYDMVGVFLEWKVFFLDGGWIRKSGAPALPPYIDDSLCVHASKLCRLNSRDLDDRQAKPNQKKHSTPVGVTTPSLQARTLFVRCSAISNHPTPTTDSRRTFMHGTIQPRESGVCILIQSTSTCSPPLLCSRVV